MFRSVLYGVLDRIPRLRDYAAHLRLSHAVGGIARAHVALGHYEKVAGRRKDAANAAAGAAIRRAARHEAGISQAQTLRHNIVKLTTERL